MLASTEPPTVTLVRNERVKARANGLTERNGKRLPTSHQAKFTPCERTVLNLKTKSKYDRELPKRLYSYFVNTVTDCSSVPSFSKFARSIGATLEDLESYRSHSEFDRAWRDCIEIRRDYLTDCALTRRYDPSFVKFLLGLELDTVSEGEEDKTLAVTVKVEN